MFLQEASNKLLPYQPYNHKIEIEDLKGLASLGYSLLYQHSILELQEMKLFLEENLQQSFIEPSKTLFTLSVLFVKKPNRALHFCIDYCQLNTLTCKDRYPLLLIDKTLVHLV